MVSQIKLFQIFRIFKIDIKVFIFYFLLVEMLGTVEYLDDTDGTLIFSTNAEEKDKLVMQIGTSDPDRAVQVLKKVYEKSEFIIINNEQLV